MLHSVVVAHYLKLRTFNYCIYCWVWRGLERDGGWQTLQSAVAYLHIQSVSAVNCSRKLYSKAKVKANESLLCAVLEGKQQVKWIGYLDVFTFSPKYVLEPKDQYFCEEASLTHDRIDTSVAYCLYINYEATEPGRVN